MFDAAAWRSGAVRRAARRAVPRAILQAVVARRLVLAPRLRLPRSNSARYLLVLHALPHVKHAVATPFPALYDARLALPLAPRHIKAQHCITASRLIRCLGVIGDRG